MVGAGGPPHDPAREQIHDDGQVEPALPRADVGDVGDPGGVWPRGGELSLQEIRDQHRGLADGPASRPIAMQRAKIGLAHQPRDAMLAAGLARFTQIEEHARSAVDAMARDERCANQAKQSGILLGAVRDRAAAASRSSRSGRPRGRGTSLGRCTDLDAL